MKTAISIPDPLFDAAERVSKRLGISRSRLYAEALKRFLESERGKRVRDALDAVYANESSELDPGLTAAAYRVLCKEKW